MDLYQAGPSLPDLELRENQVIRIYDIVFDYENLLGTDAFYRQLCRARRSRRPSAPPSSTISSANTSPRSK